MTFEELENIVLAGDNKKECKRIIQCGYSNTISLYSSLYNKSILIGSFKFGSFFTIDTKDDLFRVINEIDPEILKNPFYLEIDGFSQDNDSLSFLKSLEDDVYVRVKINEKIKLDKLDCFKSEKCKLCIGSLISLDDLKCIVKNCNYDYNSSIDVTINSLKEDDIDFINDTLINFFMCHITINTIEDANLLIKIKPEILEKSFVYIENDDLFKLDKSHEFFNLKSTFFYKSLIIKELYKVKDLADKIELIRMHIPDDATDLEKVVYISMFICNYFRYDDELSKKLDDNPDLEDITMLDFINRGKGVCRHYADFTCHILEKVGVEAQRVDAFDEESGHAFNVVTIDGKMYFLDNTWLASNFVNKRIKNICESDNFLTSNEEFGHVEYKEVLDEYECVTYNREKIYDATKKVLDWNKNYIIRIDQIKDLIKKHSMKKNLSVEEKIESSIPGRRIL